MSVSWAVRTVALLVCRTWKYKCVKCGAIQEYQNSGNYKHCGSNMMPIQ